MVDADTFLAHYGKKGMKWGVVNDDVVDTAGSPSRPTAKRSSNGSASESSKRKRLELEAHYLEKGITGEAAQQKIDKRLKVEKGLKIAGAVAVVGLGAYVAKNQLGKRYAGVTLEKGFDLTYINAMGPKADYNRRLYTTFNEGDTKKYRGLLASQLRQNQTDTTIYETKLTAREQIKAPSNKEAARIYKELVSKGQLDAHPQGYKYFNKDLVTDGPGSKTFYSEMSKRGYNALLDTNDQFISGYNTKKPLILFNAESSTVKTGEKIVSKQTTDGLANRQKAAIVGKSFIPHAAVGAALVAVSKKSKSKNKYEAVNAYLAEHPNSKMTPAQIFNSLQQEPDGNYRVPSKSASTKKGGRK